MLETVIQQRVTVNECESFTHSHYRHYTND